MANKYFVGFRELHPDEEMKTGDSMCRVDASGEPTSSPYFPHDFVMGWAGKRASNLANHILYRPNSRRTFEGWVMIHPVNDKIKPKDVWVRVENKPVNNASMRRPHRDNGVSGEAIGSTCYKYGNEGLYEVWRTVENAMKDSCDNKTSRVIPMNPHFSQQIGLP